ncbi:MAG: nucleotidyltransferase domain-containing protein [Saprospiraceae bacterium]
MNGGTPGITTVRLGQSGQQSDIDQDQRKPGFHDQAMNRINKEEILTFLRDHKEEFLLELQLVRIGLFGSYAMGQANEQSDIDLIVEFQPGTENLSEKKDKLKDLVSERFDKQVDVCREKYIKPYFKQHILQSAIYV